MASALELDEDNLLDVDEVAREEVFAEFADEALDEVIVEDVFEVAISPAPPQAEIKTIGITKKQ